MKCTIFTDRTKVLQLGTTLLLTLLLAGSCKQQSASPNILFIMTDQQSVNTIGAYGNRIIKTPNLDEIATNGLLFMQCHVASYPCSPSRASILSGKYSHNHGVVTNNISLDESLPLMGNLLRNEGYATSFFGKSHMGGFMHRNVPQSSARTSSAERDRPWNGVWNYIRIDHKEEYEIKESDYIKKLADGHVYVARQGGKGEDESCFGFDHWVGGWKQYRDFLRANGYDSLVENNHHLGAHGTVFTPPGEGGFGDSWHAWSVLPEEKHQEAFFVNEAINYLENTWSGDRPFGMFLSFYGPHHPLLPPRPWNDMYNIDDIPLPGTIADKRMIGGEGTFRGSTWTDEQFSDYIRRYWGFTSFIDAQIGKLLDHLRESGELDNTIIVFTSDHGDMAGEHGSIYKSTLCGWDELMRVPLIVSYPGNVVENSSTDALVSNIDLLPTILDLISTEIPDGLDGESFKHVLKDAGQEHRERLFISVMGMNFMAVDKEWKYNMNLPDGVEDELYNRIEDPGEMNNLAGNPDYLKVSENMRQAILNWLEETGHPYAGSIAEKR